MRNTKEKDRTYRKYLPELGAVLVLLAARIAAASVWGMQPVGDMTFYELAEVGEASLPTLDHQAEGVFVCLLSALLHLLGNKCEVAGAMQLVLLLMAGLLFSVVVRKMYGRGAAVLFLLLSAGMPELLSGYQRILPDALLLLVMGLVLLAFAFSFSMKAEKAALQTGIVWLLAGCMAGVLLWLDLLGLTLVLGLVTGILLPCRQGRLMQKWIAVCGIIMGTALGFAGLCLIENSKTGGGFLAVASSCFTPYIEGLQPVVLQLSDWIVLAALLTGGCLLVFLSAAFGDQKAVGMTAAGVVVLAGIRVLYCMNMTQMSYDEIESTYWLLVGCGMVQVIWDWCAAKKKQEQNEKMEQCIQAKAEEQKQEVQETNYIPNPLPLPKKHERRELKFDYEPLPEQMKYDYELKEGEEDFDIK